MHISDLTENGCPTEKSFDWLKVLKYHMDIHNVLRAKTAMNAMGTIHTDVFTNRSVPIRAESAQGYYIILYYIEDYERIGNYSIISQFLKFITKSHKYYLSKA